MPQDNLLAQCRAEGNYSPLIEQVPYARMIGMRIEQRGDEILFVLPALASNIGNPTLPALHGGLIGGFIEHSAILFTVMSVERAAYPRVVDLSIDYLSAGHFRDTFAECRVLREGRRIVNVSVEVWQTTRAKPIATARVHMMVD